MSSDLGFASARRDKMLLQQFLRDRPDVFVNEPVRLLLPLFDYLSALHHGGGAHGALMPSCLYVAMDGTFDLETIKTRCGSLPEPIEALNYYPNGSGQSIEERQMRDVEALAAVLYLIITDQPPARRQNFRLKLQDQVHSREWPNAFILFLDRVLDGKAEALAEGVTGFSRALAPLETTSPLVRSPELIATTQPETVERVQALSVTPETNEPLAPEPPPAAPLYPPISFPTIRLPNAMVGRALELDILNLLESDWPAIARTEPLSAMPACLEMVDGVLKGTPDTSGDLQITLRFHLSHPEPNRPSALDRSVSLVVNPDPRSLWKNIDSDRALEFWKPDTATATLTEGPLTVLGASSRGRSHAHVGSCRDDDLGMDYFSAKGWYSLTVADGAGSSKFSRQGSKIACECVTNHFADYFAQGGPDKMSEAVAHWSQSLNEAEAGNVVRTELYTQFGTAALNARKAIDDQAAVLHATARDFHTTLVTVLVHPLHDGQWFVAAFSIGDGGAALVGVPGGDPCLLTRPDGGDFAGQTVFLTMKEALGSGETIMARIRMTIVPSFEALLLVTDGISDPRFDSETRLAMPSAWDELWQEIRGVTALASSHEEAAASLLDWMGFHSPGHHDDRSVVLATSSFSFPRP